MSDETQKPLPPSAVPDFSMLRGTGKLRVIVTRPISQALPWIETLRSHGIEAYPVPLIDIEPATDSAPVVQVWQDLKEFALVMFVSANAVQQFFALRPLETVWPLSALAASTGPGTTAALQQAGLRGAMIVEPVPGAGYDSEALWARLRSRDWTGSRVLIVRGEDGREWLADQFRSGGAVVQTVAAYRRVAPVHGPETLAVLDESVADPSSFCWLFTSSEAIGHLVELTPKADWSSSKALVTHLRIAHAARAAGFGDVHLMDAQPMAVVATIRQIQHLPRLV